MTTISVKERMGIFAEDKDVAQGIRENELRPVLSAGKKVCIDFTGVEGVTQSCLHAMVRGLIHDLGVDTWDRILFKGCNPSVKGIIAIVCEYSQLDTASDASDTRASRLKGQAGQMRRKVGA